MQKSGTKSKSSVGQFFVELTRKPIFIPIVALLLLAIFNLIMDPGFYAIALNHNSEGYPVLSGSLITILDNGSELAILAIGMTLVTAATGGQDISVGAAVAIAGSVILRVLCGTETQPESLQAPVIVAFLLACVVAISPEWVLLDEPFANIDDMSARSIAAALGKPAVFRHEGLCGKTGNRRIDSESSFPAPSFHDTGGVPQQQADRTWL